MPSGYNREIKRFFEIIILIDEHKYTSTVTLINIQISKSRSKYFKSPIALRFVKVTEVRLSSASFSFITHFFFHIYLIDTDYLTFLTPELSKSFSPLSSYRRLDFPRNIFPCGFQFWTFMLLSLITSHGLHSTSSQTRLS